MEKERGVEENMEANVFKAKTNGTRCLYPDLNMGYLILILDQLHCYIIFHKATQIYEDPNTFNLVDIENKIRSKGLWKDFKSEFRILLLLLLLLIIMYFSDSES